MKIRDVIKKSVPTKILRLTKIAVSSVVLRYYRKQFAPLIVRKNTSDLDVFRQIFVQGDYNLPVKISPKLIIDAGANVGYSALYFNKKYPEAKIIAIEPEASNFEILKMNTRDIKNIIPVHAGLWHKDGILEIIDAGFGKWGFMTVETKKDEKEISKIKTITIDRILKKYGFDKIDLLKIDIEGAEKEIFTRNYDNWLNRVGVLVIELHDHFKPGCSKAFYAAVSKHQWIKKEKGENVILIRKRNYE